MKADAWKYSTKPQSNKALKDTWHMMQLSDPGQSVHLQIIACFKYQICWYQDNVDIMMHTVVHVAK